MSADRPGLTLSEARVARLVAEGRADHEIAERLGITVVEVDAELAGVFHKLGLSTRSELVVLLAPPTPAEASPGDERLP